MQVRRWWAGREHVPGSEGLPWAPRPVPCTHSARGLGWKPVWFPGFGRADCGRERGEAQAVKAGAICWLRGSRAFSEAQAARWEPRSVAPAAPAVRLLWAVPVFPPGSSRLRTSRPCWSGESQIRDGTSVQRHKVWGSGCPPGSFQPGRRLPLLSSACCGWVAAGKSKPSSSPFSAVIPRRFVPLCC